MSEDFYGSQEAFKKTFNPISPARILRERRFLKIIKSINLNSANILDIGCGRATLLNKIHKIAPNNLFYGTEYSKILVDHNISLNSHINFFKWDLENTSCPLEEIKFDLIICQEVIEHLSPDAQARIINKVYSLLNPNGFFLLSTPCKDKLLKFVPEGLTYENFAQELESQPIANHLMMEDLQNLFIKSNFKIIEHFVVAPILNNKFITNIICILLVLLPSRIEDILIRNNILSIPRFQIVISQKID